LTILDAVVTATLLLVVLRQFGLLALVIHIAVGGIILAAPLTLDPSRWYFWNGAPAVGIVLGLAILGFLNVLGKQTLLPAGAMDG